MNGADWWLTLDRLGFRTAWLLLSGLWQSSILIAAAGLLVYLLRRRRASVRHAILVVAILASPLIPLLGWAASKSGTPQAPIPIVPAYSPPAEPLPRAPEIHEAVPIPETDHAAATVQQEEPPPPEKTFSLLGHPWALVLLAYTAGAIGLLSLVAVGKYRIGRWVRRGRLVTDPRVLGIFRAARERLGLDRDTTVVESGRVLSPVTVGMLHPVVLLPAGLVGRSSDEDLLAIALHELAHVRRYDSPLLTVLSLVRAALFFHPLIWLACRQVSTLAESACDDAVLDATGEPVSYAKMLARLAEHLPRHALATELAAGIVWSKGAFLKRVEAILSDRRDRIRRLTRLALLGTLLAAAVSIALALAVPLGEKTDEELTTQTAAFDLLTIEIGSTIWAGKAKLTINADGSGKFATSTWPPPWGQRGEWREIDLQLTATQLEGLHAALEQCDWLQAKTLQEPGPTDTPEYTFQIERGGKYRQVTASDWRKGPYTQLVTLTDALVAESRKRKPEAAPPPATQPAAADLRTRTVTLKYDVRELIDAAKNTGPKARDEFVEDLTSAIRSAVDPRSWAPTGEQGEIRELSGQLIITQTRINHRAIRKLLENLREGRAAHVLMEMKTVRISPKMDKAARKLPGWRVLAVMAGAPPMQMILDDQEAGTLLARWKKGGRTKALAAPRRTALSGQMVTFKTGNFAVGASVRARASVSADRRLVTIRVAPRVTVTDLVELHWLPYDPTTLISTGFVPPPEQRFVQLPELLVQTLKATVSIPDGRTLVLRLPPVAKRQRTIMKTLKEKPVLKTVEENVPLDHVTYLLVKAKVVVKKEVQEPAAAPTQPGIQSSAGKMYR